MSAPTLFAPLEPWPFGDLRPHAFNLIEADPPWRFQNWSERGEEKGAAAQYECLTVGEIIKRFPIGDLAEPNCLLLCWVTWPMIEQQLAAIQAWGFSYRSMIVWRKIFPSGKTAMGTGYRVRAMSEGIAVAVKGEPEHDAFPGIFDGVRREHSRKPGEFYDLVVRATPRLKRRVSLFTRETHAGFASFGDEATMFDEAGAA